MKSEKVFTRRVLNIVSRIPRGATMTYRDVARAAGRPRAYRAVGNILNSYDATRWRIPCHRVVRSDGASGGFRWGAKRKTALLRAEARTRRGRNKLRGVTAFRNSGNGIIL